MEALPMPIDGGMEPLKNFFAIVNLDDDDQQALIVGYLMSVLQPSGLRPALALSGTQGSGKSTLARMIKRMLDPNRTDLRSIPHTERDLFVAAKNSAILAFDNVSSIPLSMSDPLCRLASGTGFGVRKNYSDDEEMLFEGGRSILLNGIPAELCDRDDLRDRTIVVALPQIPSDRRLTEQELWRRFDELHPQVLGSLFTAAAIALKNYKSINVASSPRMADFYKWVLAAESALPLAIGQFAEAFEHDRRDATDSTLDNSPVGSTIISLIEMKPNRIWRGTYMELLEELERLVNGQFRGRFDWPKTAKALSVLIQRMKPALKERGIEITKLPRQGIGHRIQIKKGGD
jgi:energy-coupling factor transporter ATP-binding protein EcfA2